METIYNEDRTERVRVEYDDDYSLDDALEYTDLELYVSNGNRYLNSYGTGDYRWALDALEERGIPSAFIRYMRIFHDVEVVPVYMYAHSGVALSTTPFSCRWDSGLAGFAFIHPERGADYPDPRGVAVSLVETANEVLSGEVYGLIHEERQTKQWELFNTKGERVDYGEEEDWEELDSCWGFIGPEYAEAEARAALGLTEEVAA